MQRDVVTGYFAYPLSEVKQVLRFYAEHSSNLPDEMNMGAGIGNRPGQEPSLAIYFVWCGDANDVEKHIAPLHKAGTVVSEGVRTEDYVAVQRSGDSGDVREFTGQIRTGFVNQISDEFIDKLIDNLELHPDRGTRVGFAHQGGAISRVGRTETAYSQREAQYTLMSFVSWAPGADGTEHIDYIDSHWSNVEPLTTGFYVNDYFNHTPKQVSQTYRENYPRLLKIKQEYDPTNLFRLNANIRAT